MILHLRETHFRLQNEYVLRCQNELEILPGVFSCALRRSRNSLWPFKHTVMMILFLYSYFTQISWMACEAWLEGNSCIDFLHMIQTWTSLSLCALQDVFILLKYLKCFLTKQIELSFIVCTKINITAVPPSSHEDWRGAVLILWLQKCAPKREISSLQWSIYDQKNRILKINKYL